jgi:uncharacterized circularly permuted ATP-grasp superfamily protein
MDSVASTVEKHQQILTQYLQEWADTRNLALGNRLEYQMVADTVRHHYQLVRLGWSGQKFVHFVLLHFDIKPDGKIWIQQNNTEILVGKELTARGVLPTNIVVGFRPEYMREASGYAVR